MSYKVMSRRAFLQGTGGVLLTVPTLPSLLSKAEAQLNEPKKRFISFMTRSGMNLYSWDPTIEANLVPGSTVKVRSLTGYPGNISKILNEPFNSLKSKIAIIRGLDWAGGHSHNYGMLTGFPYRITRSNEKDLVKHISMDQVLAKSNKIYPSPPVTPVLNMSYATSSVQSHILSGNEIQFAPSYTDPAIAFGELFSKLGGSGQSSELSRKASLLDFVLESYNRISKGSKISASDRIILEQHADHLRDIERAITANSNLVCSQLPFAPKSFKERGIKGHFYEYFSNPTEHKQFLDTTMSISFDIMVAALRCGLTNICNYAIHYGQYYNFLPNVYTDHHSHSHKQKSEPVPYDEISIFLMSKVAEFISKLDVPDPSGQGSILDNSMFLYTSSLAAAWSHGGYNLPVLLAGGLNGKIKMDRYIDYKSDRSWSHVTSHSWYEKVGIPYMRLLATLLQAFGLTPEEYEQGQKGFGNWDSNAENWVNYDRSLAVRNQPLELIMA
ncbi:MAG: DUF1552 domain-containing protein [Bdellovibrionales bacterium]|nr:DUF1552 domain-containing protein [Bdellovibrionales bacterium]